MPLGLAASADPIDLNRITTITSTAVVRRGVYDRPSADIDRPALTISGDGITVDFNNAELRGTALTADPDRRTGLAIRVRGRNITIKNLRARGYKIGLLAESAPGLRILNSDLSYNYRPRLLSTPEREDLSDWMSYHHNEQGEWKRYGAAIYLDGCDGFEIRGARATGGQNGLMINRSQRGLVWNSDFSYLSGIGIGMSRSSNNRIMHNRIDYCLRGFSYGKYNRGQDSAAILVYEQSNRNVFAYNSATHSGDGFFLWAGQQTMDTGQGGCNDNLLYANDFSHAPTNGIEATFSRNRFVNNLLLECWHGVWGGYSYNSHLTGNVFGFNEEGIAIEHGQSILVAGNTFYRDGTGARLWANPGAPDPTWGYPKHRDTRSHGYEFRDNRFEGASNVAVDLARTTDVNFRGNVFNGNRNVLRMGADVSQVRGEANALLSYRDYPTVDSQIRTLLGLTLKPAPAAIPNAKQTALTNTREITSEAVLDAAADTARFESVARNWHPLTTPRQLRQTLKTPSPRERALMELGPTDWVAPLKDGMNPFIRPGVPRGWRTMFVDAWGPVDSRTPQIVSVVDVTHSGIDFMDGVQYLEFTVTGPPGRARLVTSQGLSVNLPRDERGQMYVTVPGSFTTMGSRGSAGELRVELEYVGERTVDYRGVATAKGRPVRFEWSELRIPMEWTVAFYRWDEPLDANDPQRHPRNPFAGKPIRQDVYPRLDFASGGAFFPGGPTDRFATIAETTVTIPDGRFDLELTADDGVRVFVDGKLALDEWHYQGPTSFRVPLPSGQRKIRIEHFEIDGHATLTARIAPRRAG